MGMIAVIILSGFYNFLRKGCIQIEFEHFFRRSLSMENFSTPGGNT